MTHHAKVGLVNSPHLDFIVTRFGILGAGATLWTRSYPDSRSDSAGYSQGYRFKPRDASQAIGTADEIRAKLGELIEEACCAAKRRSA